MGIPETNLKNKHDATLTRWQRLIRVNCGISWGGEVISRARGVLKLIHFGVVQGAEAGTSDQVGFDSVVITPDMVPPEGLRVAVFVACEIKAGKDRLRPAQKNFRDMVVGLGGIHRVVRDNKVIESGFNYES